MGAGFTEKFVRLPEASGVPTHSLIGYKFAKIPSRETVQKQIHDFISDCIGQSKAVNVQIIRAEWGEGKTDAYERYILPELQSHNQTCLKLSTSTLIARMKAFESIFPSPQFVVSTRFLASVFAGITDELEAESEEVGGGEKPPALFEKPDGSKSSQDYVLSCLKRQRELDKGKIFIFLDEFEELIDSPKELQSHILSGIKELLNGQFKAVHEGGAFQGAIHFFICCTPYAYLRIMENPDFGQIAPSLKSRMNIINLPPIRKDEAVRFILDLLRYSYDNKMPSVFPFKNLGPVDAIYRSAHGNLRSMIQLFHKVMLTAVDEKQGKLRVIDSSVLIQALQDETVYPMGEESKAIDSETLIRYCSKLDKNKDDGKGSSLVRLLVGEPIPHSLAELSRQFGIKDRLIHDLVDRVNQGLAGFGIRKAIVPLMPVKPKKDISEVLSHLHFTGDDIVLQSGRINLTTFKDKLYYYECSGENLSTAIYIPKDEGDLVEIFDANKPAEVSELFDVISRDFETSADSRCYVVSNELLEQIYPSPLLRMIDFIEDRGKRMELWRRATKDYLNLEDELREGIVDMLNQSGIWSFSGRSTGSGSPFQIEYGTQTQRAVKMSVLVHLVVGDVKDKHIEDLKDLIRQYRPALPILAYVGELQTQIPVQIDQIDQPVLTLGLKRMRAIQLLVERLALKESVSINEGVLLNRLREIAEEADIGNRVSSWYARCNSLGIILNDIRTSKAESGIDLVKVLRFYVNFMGERMTSEEYFNRLNSTLLQLKLRGERSFSFAPKDMESSKEFSSYEEDLVENRFLSRNDKRVVWVTETPQEKRVIQVLKSRGSRSAEELGKFFINASSLSEMLSKVFLELLESKGQIEEKDGKWSLVDTAQAKMHYDTAMKTFRRDIASKPPDWQKYGHLYVVKKYKVDVGTDLVKADSFSKVLDEVERKIPNLDEASRRQRYWLVNKVCEYYKDEIESRIDEAYKQAKNLVSNEEAEVARVRREAQVVLDAYNEYTAGKSYTLQEVQEYLDLSRQLELVREAAKFDFDSPSDFDQVIAEFESSREDFKFSNLEDRSLEGQEKAHYFNLKYAKIQKACKGLDTAIKRIQSYTDNSQQLLKEIDKRRERINLEVSAFDPPPQLRCSRKMLKQIQDYRVKPLTAQSEAIPINLEAINGFFNKLKTLLDGDIHDVKGTLSCLVQLLETEKLLNHAKVDKLIEKGSGFFGQDPYRTNVLEMLTQTRKAGIDSDSFIDASFSSNFQTLDELTKYAQQVRGSLDDKLKAILKAKGDFQAMLEELVKQTDLQKKSLSSLLLVLTKSLGQQAVSRCQTEYNAYELELEKDESVLQKVMAGTYEGVTWDELSNDLVKSKNAFFEKLATFLPGHESEVLVATIDVLGNKSVISYSSLLESVKLKLNMESEDCEKALRSLLAKGVLCENIGLPI